MDALERDIFGGIENAMTVIADEITVIADEMQRMRVVLERLEPALRKPEAKQEPVKPEPLAPIMTVLDLPITALEISTRAINTLIDNRCRSIEDVTKLTRHKLESTWSCGDKTIKEIEAALTKRGLKLAT